MILSNSETGREKQTFWRFCDPQRSKGFKKKIIKNHLLQLTGVIIKGPGFLPSSFEDGLKNG